MKVLTQVGNPTDTYGALVCETLVLPGAEMHQFNRGTAVKGIGAVMFRGKPQVVILAGVPDKGSGAEAYSTCIVPESALSEEMINFMENNREEIQRLQEYPMK